LCVLLLLHKPVLAVTCIYSPYVLILASLCVGGGKGVKDGKDRKSKKKAGDEEEAEEETYYDAMKKEMGDRAARTKVQQLDVTLYSSPTSRLLCIMHGYHACVTMHASPCMQ